MNIKYPQIAQENGIQGVALARFVIDEQGELTSIEVLQSPDKVLSDAAISVLQKSPKWMPGLRHGKPAKVMQVISIAFRLQN